MHDPHITRLLGLIWLFPLMIIVPWCLESLFHIGGKPVIEGKTICFRLKPLMRAITWILAALGAAGVWYGARTFNEGGAAAVIVITVSIAALVLAVSCQGEILLDDEGIHYRRAVLSNCSIAWRDLSCFEKEEVRNWKTQVSSTNYVFCGAGGERIAATSMSFDVEDLLRCVQQRHACPEKSYRRPKIMFKAPLPRPRHDRASRSDRS